MIQPGITFCPVFVPVSVPVWPQVQSTWFEPGSWTNGLLYPIEKWKKSTLNMLNRQFTNRLGNVAWPQFEMKAFWRFTRDLWPLLCVWDHGTLFSFWLMRNSSKFLRHHLPVPHFSALKNLDQIHALWKSYHFKIVMLYSNIFRFAISASVRYEAAEKWKKNI